MKLRGVVLCSPVSRIPDILRFIWMLRYVWKSYIPVNVFHCGEYSDDNIFHLTADNQTSVTDLCMKEDIYGMNLAEAQKRLRGFFCKTAALIESPFEHTLLVDSDTLFFKHPETLFGSKQYIQTGAFFFNDRTITKNGFNRWTDWLKYFESHGVSINKDNIDEMAAKYGGTPFFHALRMKFNALPYPVNMHTAEASAVYFHKKSHPKTIAFLARQIATFNLGWGDKEIYWTSVLCSQEPFIFSPYLPSVYAGCNGATFHWDPTEPLAMTTPYSMNTESILEHAVTVGHQVNDRVTVAVEFNTTIPGSYLWTLGDCNPMRERQGRCSCHRIYRDDGMDKLISPYVLLAQYVGLKYRMQYLDMYRIKGLRIVAGATVVVPDAFKMDIKEVLRKHNVVHPMVSALLN